MSLIPDMVTVVLQQPAKGFSVLIIIQIYEQYIFYKMDDYMLDFKLQEEMN